MTFALKYFQAWSKICVILVFFSLCGPHDENGNDL